MKNLRFALGMLFIGAVTLTSCLKKNYDGPPDTSGYDPKLAVNLTVSQLNAMAYSGAFQKITTDYTISGVVVADDRSGNLYKQFVIQDSTGGIAISVDAYDLYGDYPVGRKVYIKLKGLYIGNYHSLPQLGYTVDNTGSLVGIPGNLKATYIVKANYPNAVPVKHITLAQALSNDKSLLNTLVTIDSVMEFSDGDAGQVPFAQPATISSATDVYAEDCSGTTIDVRTSGYANFATYPVPTGRGSLTGILTVYNSTAQIIIRDTSDVKFNGPRCPGSTLPTLIGIDSLRKMYNGTDVALHSLRIKGVVISDNLSMNFSSNSKTIYLQDGDRGISVFFTTAQSFAPGDSITISIDGGTLTNYNGVLEVKGVSSSRAIKVGDGHLQPKQVTIAEINTNYSNYEGTLVKVVNASFTPGGTYAGSGDGKQTLSDGSGNITLYTAGAATMLRAAVVPGGAHTVIAVVNEYNTEHQLQIRSTADVQ